MMQAIVTKRLISNWLPLVLALIFAASSGAASAQAPSRTLDADPLEDRVKAAFIFDFLKFVEWPPEAMPAAAPVTVCVVGNDRFADLLARVVEGKSSGARSVVVRKLEDPRGIEPCQILFVALRNRGEVRRLLRRLRFAPVLTVGDADEFDRLGGIVQFFRQDNKVRFRINVDAARRSGLAVSSRLLALADVARESGGKVR